MLRWLLKAVQISGLIYKLAFTSVLLGVLALKTFRHVKKCTA